MFARGISHRWVYGRVWVENFREAVSTAATSDDEEAKKRTRDEEQVVVNQLNKLVRICSRVISVDAVTGAKRLARLRKQMERLGDSETPRAILHPVIADFLFFLWSNNSFWIEMSAHLTSTHVLAFVDATPNRSLVLEVTWSDRQLSDDIYTPLTDRDQRRLRTSPSRLVKFLFERSNSLTEKQKRRAIRLDRCFDIITRVLISMSLVPRTFRRRCENVMHAESYYFIIKDCDGVDVIRFYWDNHEHNPREQNLESEAEYPHISRYGLGYPKGSTPRDV